MSQNQDCCFIQQEIDKLVTQLAVTNTTSTTILEKIDVISNFMKHIKKDANLVSCIKCKRFKVNQCIRTNTTTTTLQCTMCTMYA